MSALEYRIKRVVDGVTEWWGHPDMDEPAGWHTRPTFPISYSEADFPGDSKTWFAQELARTGAKGGKIVPVRVYTAAESRQRAEARGEVRALDQCAWMVEGVYRDAHEKLIADARKRAGL